MGRNSSRQLAAPVAALSRRIEKWRRGGTRRGSPMPAELWAEAATLTQKFGVYRISQDLGLAYTRLKQQAQLQDTTAPSAPGMSFVEVHGLEIGDSKESSLLELELSRSDGTIMRLRSSGSGGLDLAGVVGAFCGERR